MLVLTLSFLPSCDSERKRWQADESMKLNRFVIFFTGGADSAAGDWEGAAMFAHAQAWVANEKFIATLSF